MTSPVVRLVDAPKLEAKVLYDFNVRGDSTYTGHDGLDFGAPEWSGNPGAVGGVLGYRKVTFTHYVNTKLSDAYTAVSNLGRAISASDAWLLVQLSPYSEPRWFRTWRSAPGSLTWDDVMIDDAANPSGFHAITVTLTADPVLYGQRVTLPSVTIVNDAANAAKCSMVLAPIKGDTPTPLRVGVNPSETAAMDGYRWMIASHSGTVSTLPTVWDIGTGDGWTAGTDTSGAVTDAAYSGGSYRAVSFSTTPGMTARLSGAAPSVPAAGTYKVLVRAERTDSTSTFAVQFGQQVNLAYRYGATASLDRDPTTAGYHATWLDLGEFSFPFALNIPDDATDIPAAPDVAVAVGRTSGSGSLSLDSIMLVPVDLRTTTTSRLLFAEFNSQGVSPGPGVSYFDGEIEAVWGISAFGAFNPGGLSELTGGFAQAVPGASNTITVLQQVNGRKPVLGTDSSDSIAESTQVTVSYQPRYLWPAP